MINFDTLLDAAGGASTFCAKLNLSNENLRIMKFRGFVPRKYWPDIMANIPEVPISDLLELESQAATLKQEAANAN